CDPEIAHIAEQNVGLAGLADTVSVVNKSADDVLSEWDPSHKVDLVFIDANKSACKRYYELILSRDLLGDSGQIIVDNVLFHGKVHKQVNSSSNDSAKGIAAKMHRFNEFVASDPRTTQVLLPMFDGLLLIQKQRKGDVVLK
ncbi:hypothetical protein GGI21_000992, partial [Coemansia aciculifera]